MPVELVALFSVGLYLTHVQVKRQCQIPQTNRDGSALNAVKIQPRVVQTFCIEH